MITLDFETTYDQDFSLSKMSMESYIRDPRFQVIGVSLKKDDGPIEWVTGDDEIFKAALLRYGCDRAVCVAHNAAFDMAIMNWRYGIKPKLIIDTLSLARPITGMTVGCTLRALAEYFGIGHKGTEIYNTKGKRLEDFTPEELEAFGEYCRTDVQLTYDLLKKLRPFTTDKEIYLIDMVIRMFTEPVLELNAELLENHLKKIRADKDALLDSVAHGDRDAFMSNDRFAELLRAEGVEPPTKVSAKTGKTAWAFAKTDKEFTELANHPNERVQALVAARLGLKSTIEETRTEAFLAIAKRGLFPVLLNYYGAANTGRFSGGDKTNPQNLPRGGVLRQAIQAPDGYVLVACDSSQIEARTLAWFSGQSDLVEEFANGADVYSSFASKVYDRPINKHDDPEERHVGKTAILGLGYSVGAAKLQHTLENGFVKVKLPLEECQRIVGVYRSSFPMIPKLWKACQHAIECLYQGYDTEVGVGVQLRISAEDQAIFLPNGMRLVYPEIQMQVGERGWPEYTYRKTRFRNRLYGGMLTENIVQALARIIVSYQMCKIKQALDRKSKEAEDGKIRRVVHMVHDEVIVVVPEEEAEETKRLMENTMSTPPAWASDLPVACEAGVGKTYVEAK